MTTRFALALVAPVLFLAARVAAAQSVPSPPRHVGVSVKLTTLGVAIEGATPVHERVNVRAGFNVFGLTHDFDTDGIGLAAQLKLRSFSTYLDWFPFGGGFHVTPGVMVYNGNGLEATATVPAGRKFSLGDESLISNPANPVTGTAKIAFEKVAPVLLIGWGNLIPRGERRWSIPFETGVVYSRAPTATLNLGGSACSPGGTNCRSIAGDAGLQRDLTTQQNKMNSDLSVLKALPIISLGFSYRF